MRSADIVAFWKQAGASKWFGKDTAFDTEFRQRFLADYEQAAAGELDHWMADAEGALALMILLDQFPRNSFRDTARMFATDNKALALAGQAIEAGFDRQVPEDLRLFFYLPFEHSEALADQEMAVQLITPLGAELLHWAEVHRDVIVKFGRYPHRNRLLGRESTPEELEFLASGGFAG